MVTSNTQYKCSLVLSFVHSIDQLLLDRKENPEEVLMNLGFGAGRGTLAERLPIRFLLSQTKATGIQVEEFLKGHPEMSGYYGMDSDFGKPEFVTLLISAVIVRRFSL